MSALSSVLTIFSRALWPTVAVGAATLLLFLWVQRRPIGTKKPKGKGRGVFTASDAQMNAILRSLRIAQTGEGRAHVDSLLSRYYARWAADVVKSGDDSKDLIGDAEALRGMTSGSVAATLIDGLGMVEDAAGNSYAKDMVLPMDLVEAVNGSIIGSIEVATAFHVSGEYFKICKGRRLAASEGIVPTEEVYNTLLIQLWEASFSKSLVAPPSNQPEFQRTGDGWADLGFQGKDPITDLRGGALTALKDYVVFAQNNAALHAAMIQYNRDQHATKGTAWFLEACVSIQLTVQLTTTAFDVVPPAPSPSTGGTGKMRKLTPSAPSTSPLHFTHRIIIYLYDGPKEEVQTRLQTLHALYMRAFFELWKREKPFIMEYQGFMEKTFYPEASQLVEAYLQR